MKKTIYITVEEWEELKETIRSYFLFGICLGMIIGFFIGWLI